MGSPEIGGYGNVGTQSHGSLSGLDTAGFGAMRAVSDPSRRIAGLPKEQQFGSPVFLWLLPDGTEGSEKTDRRVVTRK